jgi:hypothetical protein
LILPVPPYYPPQHESPQMDNNECWMLRCATMQSRQGVFIE